MRAIAVLALLAVLELVSLSSHEEVAPEPDGQPGGQIVFSGNLSGVWQLYSCRWGTPPVRLVASDLDVRSPATSPRGTRIAYTTSDGALWSIQVGTREVRKLGGRFANGQYGFPTWIDEETLAYTTYVVTPPTEDSELFTYSFKDGKPRLLIKQTGSQDFPSASLSGSRLAFMSSLTTQVTGFGSTITQQLWTASLQTGALEQLTTGSARDTRPAWSPDEKRIAFSSDRKGGPYIWLVDVETKALTQLTSGAGAHTDPCWSPDGRRVMFVSNTSGRYGLDIIDVQSRTVITFRPFGDKNVELRDPAWGR